MKLEQKIKAVQLRRQGTSYSEIRKRVDVSKSTLSLWLREINLTPLQENLLLKGREKSRYAAGLKKKRQRIETTKRITESAQNEFATLITNNPLFLVGLSLYWAEGDKHIQERIKFTNSDPSMIALMMRWFREVCGVPEKKFRIALHIHNLQNNNDVKKYWAKITKLNTRQFQKVYIKKTSLQHRKNPLYNGTCAIVVNNKNLFRKIMGWRQGLVKKFY